MLGGRHVGKRIAIGAIIGTTVGIGVRGRRPVADMGHRSRGGDEPLAGDDLVPDPSAVETRGDHDRCAARGGLAVARPDGLRSRPAGTATTSWTCAARARARSCLSGSRSPSATSSPTIAGDRFAVRVVGHPVERRRLDDHRRRTAPTDDASELGRVAARSRGLAASPSSASAAGLRGQLGLRARAARRRADRLVERFRSRVRGAGPLPVIGPVMGFGVFMMRAQRSPGIQERAELPASRRPIPIGRGRSVEPRPSRRAVRSRTASADRRPEAESRGADSHAWHGDPMPWAGPRGSMP